MIAGSGQFAPWLALLFAAAALDRWDDGGTSLSVPGPSSGYTGHQAARTGTAGTRDDDMRRGVSVACREVSTTGMLGVECF